MRLHELEHVIRAAAEVAREPDIVVIGSQAILATDPAAPTPASASMEADIYPSTPSAPPTSTPRSASTPAFMLS